MISITLYWIVAIYAWQTFIHVESTDFKGLNEQLYSDKYRRDLLWRGKDFTLRDLNNGDLEDSEMNENHQMHRSLRREYGFWSGNKKESYQPVERTSSWNNNWNYQPPSASHWNYVPPPSSQGETLDDWIAKRKRRMQMGYTEEELNKSPVDQKPPQKQDKPQEDWFDRQTQRMQVEPEEVESSKPDVVQKPPPKQDKLQEGWFDRQKQRMEGETEEDESSEPHVDQKPPPKQDQTQEDSFDRQTQRMQVEPEEDESSKPHANQKTPPKQDQPQEGWFDRQKQRMQGESEEEDSSKPLVDQKPPPKQNQPHEDSFDRQKQRMQMESEEDESSELSADNQKTLSVDEQKLPPLHYHKSSPPSILRNGRGAQSPLQGPRPSSLTPLSMTLEETPHFQSPTPPVENRIRPCPLRRTNLSEDDQVEKIRQSQDIAPIKEVESAHNTESGMTLGPTRTNEKTEIPQNDWLHRQKQSKRVESSEESPSTPTVDQKTPPKQDEPQEDWFDRQKRRMQMEAEEDESSKTSADKQKTISVDDQKLPPLNNHKTSPASILRNGPGSRKKVNWAKRLEHYEQDPEGEAQARHEKLPPNPESLPLNGHLSQFTLPGDNLIPHDPEANRIHSNHKQPLENDDLTEHTREIVDPLITTKRTEPSFIEPLPLPPPLQGPRPSPLTPLSVTPEERPHIQSPTPPVENRIRPRPVRRTRLNGDEQVEKMRQSQDNAPIKEVDSSHKTEAGATLGPTRSNEKTEIDPSRSTQELTSPAELSPQRARPLATRRQPMPTRPRVSFDGQLISNQEYIENKETLVDSALTSDEPPQKHSPFPESPLSPTAKTLDNNELLSQPESNPYIDTSQEKKGIEGEQRGEIVRPTLDRSPPVKDNQPRIERSHPLTDTEPTSREQNGITGSGAYIVLPHPRRKPGTVIASDANDRLNQVQQSVPVSKLKPTKGGQSKPGGPFDGRRKHDASTQKGPSASSKKESKSIGSGLKNSLKKMKNYFSFKKNKPNPSNGGILDKQSSGSQPKRPPHDDKNGNRPARPGSKPTTTSEQRPAKGDARKPSRFVGDSTGHSHHIYSARKGPSAVHPEESKDVGTKVKSMFKKFKDSLGIAKKSKPTPVNQGPSDETSSCAQPPRHYSSTSTQENNQHPERPLLSIQTPLEGTNPPRKPALAVDNRPIRRPTSSSPNASDKPSRVPTRGLSGRGKTEHKSSSGFLGGLFSSKKKNKEAPSRKPGRVGGYNEGKGATGKNPPTTHAGRNNTPRPQRKTLPGKPQRPSKPLVTPQPTGRKPARVRQPLQNEGKNKSGGFFRKLKNKAKNALHITSQEPRKPHGGSSGRKELPRRPPTQIKPQRNLHQGPRQVE